MVVVLVWVDGKSNINRLRKDTGTETFKAMEAISCEDFTSKKKVAALRVSKANPEKKNGNGTYTTTVGIKKHHSKSAANKKFTCLNVDSAVSTVFANKAASFPPGLLPYNLSATHMRVERWSSLVSGIRSHLRFAKWMSYLSLFPWRAWPAWHLLSVRW